MRTCHQSFFTLDEQHIQVYWTFLTLHTLWKLVAYHRTIWLILSMFYL